MVVYNQAALFDSVHMIGQTEIIANWLMIAYFHFIRFKHIPRVNFIPSE